LAAIRRASSRVSVPAIQCVISQESRIAAAQKTAAQGTGAFNGSGIPGEPLVGRSFAEQDVRRYSTWSSVIVIVGVMVVLALLYFFLR
jgi:hypothetical protein